MNYPFKFLPSALLGLALWAAVLTPANAFATSPTIVATSISTATETSVLLGGQVNTETKKTEYHFEYITAADFHSAGDSFGAGVHQIPKSEASLPAHPAAKGDLTADSKIVTNVNFTAGVLAPGQAITGANIPDGTKIESIDAAAHRILLSQSPTATTTNVTLTGTGPQPVSVSVSGLTPGTSFLFRIVAHNADGPSQGPATAFATYAPPPAFGPCPQNQSFRAGPSALLPDCRAYEQASPVKKNGADVTASIFLGKASTGGDRVIFAGVAPLPGGEGAQEFRPFYLASRGEGVWSTQGAMPPESVGPFAQVTSWTPDLSQVFSWAQVRGEPIRTGFFARSSLDGSLTTIFPHTAGFGEPESPGGSADGSIVLFEFIGPALVPGARSEKSNLYVWDRASATNRLAGVMNDGTVPPGGTFAGSYDWVSGSTSSKALGTGGQNLGGLLCCFLTPDQHAVAADGSSVYFTAAGTGQLYLRRNPTAEQSALDGEGRCTEADKACTIEVNVSHKTDGNEPDGTEVGSPRPAAFQAASTDGKHAFFTSEEELTNESETGPEQGKGIPPYISSSNLDGEGIEHDCIPVRASGLATDETYIYWTDPGAGTIGRAKLDCSDPELSWIGGLSGINDLAVGSGHIYWTEPDNNTIGRANLEGEELQPNFLTGLNHPDGIAVGGGYVYWTSPPGHAVGRARDDGSQAIQDFFITNSPGFKVPGQGLTVDPAAGYIYVAVGTGLASTGVLRYHLDGTTAFICDALVEEVEGCGPLFYLTGDADLAIDDSYVYWNHEETNSSRESKIVRDKLTLRYGEQEDFIEGDGVVETAQSVAVGGGRIFWANNPPPSTKPGYDLYRYDAESGALTDLTPDSNPADVCPGTGSPCGAQVKGLLGTSADGSHVYFVANGDLDGAGPATLGDCKGPTPETVKGACNLYLSAAGQITFIARLQSSSGTLGDSENWIPRAHTGTGNYTPRPSRVTPDGQTLLFRSVEKLTEYENEGVPEFYLYQVGSGIVCVSCNPTGTAPMMAPSLVSIDSPGQGVGDPVPLLSRNLSTGGDRVFLESADRLVAADTNGIEGCPLVEEGIPRCQDVYEWEAPGSGSCIVGAPDYAAQDAGCLYLLSDGTSPEPAFFGDASISSDDVFIFTRSQLVGQDQDMLQDVYDTRVGGGLASQNQPPPPVPCEGEACKRGASPAPEGKSPGSANFVGPPNPSAKSSKPRCPKGKRRVKGRCVKAHKRHRRAHHDRKAQR